MNHELLFRTIDEMQNDYAQFLLDICNIESPTDCKAGVDAVGAYFIARAEEQGWTVEIHEEPIAGNVIAITMNPEAKGKPIAASGHMDTVHPVGSFGSPAARIEDGKLYGPGAIDCKGGTVSAFLAMAALQKCGFTDRPLMLLLQSDEENSSRFSEKRTIGYIAEKAKDCAAFLNCEGHIRGYLCLARKGILKYEFRVHGKAVHASKCDEGISAIAEAAHKILELEKLKDKEWGMTCNCGLIRGGSAENSVPAECVFTADIRISNAEEEAAANALVQRVASTQYIAGSSCEVTLKSKRVPMVWSERNVQLLADMNAIFTKTGLPTAEGRKRHGGSDAADITARGIPCIDNMGVSGQFLHSVDEYMELCSLAESAKRIAAVMAYL